MAENYKLIQAKISENIKIQKKTSKIQKSSTKLLPSVYVYYIINLF